MSSSVADIKQANEKQQSSRDLTGWDVLLKPSARLNKTSEPVVDYVPARRRLQIVAAAKHRPREKCILLM